MEKTSNCKHYAQRVVKQNGFPIDFQRMCYEGYDPTKCDTCKYFDDRTNDRPNDRPLVVFEEL